MSSCQSCRGQCCYDIVVRVMGNDVMRLCAAQHLEPRQIVSIEPERERTELGFRLEPGGPGLAMFLLKSASEPRACTFLMRFADTARCGVYDDRPTVCSVFPMQLERGSVGVRTDIICSKESWPLTQMNLPQWRRDLLRQNAEITTFAQIVAVWNEACDEGEAAGEGLWWQYLAGVYATVTSLDDTACEHWLDPDGVHSEARAAFLTGVEVASRAVLHGLSVTYPTRR